MESIESKVEGGMKGHDNEVIRKWEHIVNEMAKSEVRKNDCLW